MLAFLVTNAGGALLAVLCWLVARRSRLAAVAGAVALCAALVLKASLSHRPAWEAALFPWAWYIYLQGYWLFAIGAAFFALAAPLMPLPRNRRAILALSATVLVAGGISTRWMVDLPEVGADRHADALHQCMQSTPFTCAPTSCVCALSCVGIDASEREMARLCLTRKEGTTRFNTYRGLVLKLAGTPWRAHGRHHPGGAVRARARRGDRRARHLPRHRRGRGRRRRGHPARSPELRAHALDVQAPRARLWRGGHPHRAGGRALIPAGGHHPRSPARVCSMLASSMRSRASNARVSSTCAAGALAT
jgi:hypothetical protein